MKKQNALVVLLAFFLLNLCSCSNPFGPSKNDVLMLAAALERAANAPLKADKNPTEHSVYANAADLTFSTPDKTSIHHGKYFCDTDNGSFTVEGEMTFSDYYDAISGYTFQGLCTCALTVPKNYDQLSWSGNIQVDLKLTGGKITSFSYTLHKDAGKNPVFDQFTINGHRYGQAELKIAGQMSQSIIQGVGNPCASLLSK